MRGRVWTGRNDAAPFFEDAVLEIEAGRVLGVRSAKSSDDPAALDRTGKPHTFLPGLVDLHNHGGAGHSFPTSTFEGCQRASAHHRSRGTTTMLASLVSATEADLITQAAVLAELAETGMIHGIHLEGPFLSPTHCGAQDPQTLTPGDPGLVLKIIKAARGYLRTMTVAPETDNYAELVDLCVAHDIVVSLGHSSASDDEASRALDAAAEAGAGVTATHLFNGMPPLHHRNPGIAAAMLRAAARGRLTVELVADGVHLDDAMVELVLACAPKNVAFVSDAMAAAGMDDGAYTLGTAAVEVHESVARLVTPEGVPGPIAGGTSSLIDQVLRHTGPSLVSEGPPMSPEQISAITTVIRACSAQPARALGLTDRGELRPGLRADVLTLDSCGSIAGVVIAGHQQRQVY